jgi:mannosyltransferase
MVDFGRLPLGKLLTTFGSDNNHPFYSVLAWLSMHVLGESALTLRLPAVLFGALSLAMMYRFAAAHAPKREAWLAVALLMLSYHHVWFSQNARGYTMLLFFTLAASHALLRLHRSTDPQSTRMYLLAYAISMALGTYTHLSAVFVAATHGLIALAVWLRERKPRLLLAVLAAGALALALHAPILGEMITFFTPKEMAQAQVASQWTSPWWTVRAAAESLGHGLLPGLLLLSSVLLVLTCGCVGYARKRPELLVLYVLPGVLAAATMMALGRNLWPRFFFFQVGFILLIVVRGIAVIASMVSKWLPSHMAAKTEAGLFAAAGTVALLASLAILPRAYLLPKQDFEGAQAWLAQHRAPNTPVVAVGLTEMPYTRYYKTDYIGVEDTAALEHVLAEGRGAYVLNTLPTFLSSRAPELAKRVADESQEVARFAGSVGDGDVVVLRIPPRAKH